MVSQAPSTSGNIIIFRAAGVVAPVVNPIHFEAAGQICTAEGNIFSHPITFLVLPFIVIGSFQFGHTKGLRQQNLTGARFTFFKSDAKGYRITIRKEGTKQGKTSFPFVLILGRFGGVLNCLNYILLRVGSAK